MLPDAGFWEGKKNTAKDIVQLYRNTKTPFFSTKLMMSGERP